jgi:hypothetical protein
MAAKTFTTMVQIQDYIEHKCTEAVRYAMQRCVEKLREYIDEDYYEQFVPDFYTRTRQFYKSATATLLSATSAEIGIDYSMMNYGSYWDGEVQTEFASRGYHGTTEIQTDGRFWDDFVAWMDENAIDILRQELLRQGLKLVN